MLLAQASIRIGILKKRDTNKRREDSSRRPGGVGVHHDTGAGTAYNCMMYHVVLTIAIPVPVPVPVPVQYV